jgi:oligopeptidase A
MSNIQANPLLAMRGLPPFSEIRAEDVEPAIDALLAQSRAQLGNLAKLDGAPSVAGVIVPVEQLRHRLARTWSPVSHLNAVMNSDPLRAAYNACLPKLSLYHTELGQNEALYRAYASIAADPALTPTQRALVSDALRDFRLAGVALAPDRKARFKTLMQELARLQARFEENVLDAANAWSLLIGDPSRLRGLPEHVTKRAQSEAAQRGEKGWLLTLDFPTFHAVVTHADDASLRRELYEAWSTRASDRGPQARRFDNTDVMREILRLRHEVARMLDFPSFAEYSLANKMADSVAEVRGFLEDLAARSLPAGRREMQELESSAGRRLEAWDVAYYAEKLRRARYDVSDEQLRPYLPVERVLAGAFVVTGHIYGLRIERRAGVDVWHEDVRLYDVRDAYDELRGSFYVDLYARPKKRSGAWMDECVGRARLNGSVELPVAYLCCNFTPPVAGSPALLAHGEVVTLFHELGHTLHHVLTRVDYPSVAGINGVPWDAVELPSQFMEGFAWSPEVLPLISAHHETGEPLPAAMLERMIAARRFNAGMQMLRQLEFALFDLRLHAEYEPARGDRVTEVLNEVRAQVSVVPVPEFNRFAHGFTHVFGGAYAAGYYSYKWAEVLAADAFAAFEEAGVLDRATGQRFLRSILEIGGTRPVMDAFVEFRGRKPTLEALLRQCGLNGG